jgi:hypothetical protein
MAGGGTGGVCLWPCLPAASLPICVDARADDWNTRSGELYQTGTGAGAANIKGVAAASKCYPLYPSINGTPVENSRTLTQAHQATMPNDKDEAQERKGNKPVTPASESHFSKDVA